MDKFDRITFDPQIMGGRAAIRGMRVTVSLILNLVANGMTVEDILAAYPYLEADDIRQALHYGAWLAEKGPVFAPVDALHALFVDVQALPQAHAISDEEIAAEIVAYRVGLREGTD